MKTVVTNKVELARDEAGHVYTPATFYVGSSADYPETANNGDKLVDMSTGETHYFDAESHTWL